MVKHGQTIRRLLPTNCLGVFDHFVGLVLKGLSFQCVENGQFLYCKDFKQRKIQNCRKVLKARDKSFNNFFLLI